MLLRPTIHRRLRVAAGAALAVAALVPATASAGPNDPPRGVGQLPQVAGCTASEQVADKAVLYNQRNGNRIGAVRLMYSSACNTWWSRLVNDTGRAFEDIVIANSGRMGFSDRADSTFGFGYPITVDTPMVPALDVGQFGQPNLRTVGQAFGRLYGAGGLSDLVATADTMRCLPPQPGSSCPTPPAI